MPSFTLEHRENRRRYVRVFGGSAPCDHFAQPKPERVASDRNGSSWPNGFSCIDLLRVARGAAAQPEVSAAPVATPTPTAESLFSLGMRYAERLYPEAVLLITRPNVTIYGVQLNCLGLIANHVPTRPLIDSDMPKDLGYLNPDLPGLTVAVGNGPPWGIPIDHCYVLDYNRIQKHDDYVRGRHGVAHIDDYLMIVAYSVTPASPEVCFPYEIIYGGLCIRHTPVIVCESAAKQC